MFHYGTPVLFSILPVIDTNFLLLVSYFSGLFIVITPNYVINLSSYSVPDGIAGDIFCRLIFSKFFIFTFGKVSVLTITCLAVERWFALTRRWKYQASFSRRNLYRYITFIWMVSMLAQSYKLFYVRFSHRSCFFIPLSSLNRNVEIAVVIIYVSVTFFVPTIITWAAFFHTYVKLYKSQALKENRGRKEKHLLLKMCAIASLMLTLCWFPTEVCYVINQFGFPVLNFGTPFREFTVALALANSIVNPWIYVVLDKKYRCLIMGVFR